MAFGELKGSDSDEENEEDPAQVLGDCYLQNDTQNSRSVFRVPEDRLSVLR